MKVSEIVRHIIEDNTVGEINETIESEITERINNNCFMFVLCDNKPIGFFTFYDNDDGVLINNMCILKEFRSKGNLLFLRKFMRSKFKSKRFYWRNRKKGKEMVWQFS